MRNAKKITFKWIIIIPFYLPFYLSFNLRYSLFKSLKITELLINITKKMQNMKLLKKYIYVCKFQHAYIYVLL